MVEKYKGPERREACAAHHDLMKEIFQKIDRRLPIWVFLASLGIISAAFTFVGAVNRDGAFNLQARIEETTKEIKELSRSVNEIDKHQQVVLFRLDELARRSGIPSTKTQLTKSIVDKQ